MKTPFAINPNIDRAALALQFRTAGRVEIRDFISPADASALRTHLLARDDWTLVLRAASGVYELPRNRFSELTDAQKAELDTLVIQAAREGFQYRYESIRVPDEVHLRTRSSTVLDGFVKFMNSSPVLECIGEIMGVAAPHFADGQATSYSPGHFLTRHDDDIEGKHRLAAYVMGLQPDWKPEWGGLLMFHGEDGNIDGAFTPAMGSLRLFRVPAAHSVSYVNPMAPTSRLSVTGWFRSKYP